MRQSTRGISRHLLAAVISVVFTVPAVSASAQAPPNSGTTSGEGASLAGSTVLAGSVPGYVRVRLPVDVWVASEDHSGPRRPADAARFEVAGEGPLIGAMLTTDPPRMLVENDDAFFVVSSSREQLFCPHPCGYRQSPPAVFPYSREQQDRQSGEWRVNRIPRGNYRLYLLADGSPVTVRMTFPGLTGETSLTPQHATRLSAAELLAHGTGTSDAFREFQLGPATFGAEGSEVLITQETYEARSAEPPGAHPGLIGLELCYWAVEAQPESADEAFGRGCRQRQTLAGREWSYWTQQVAHEPRVVRPLDVLITWDPDLIPRFSVGGHSDISGDFRALSLVKGVIGLDSTGDQTLIPPALPVRETEHLPTTLGTRARARRGTVRVRLTCRATSPCRGTFSIGARRVRLRLKPDEIRVVRMRLPDAARRRLRRHGRTEVAARLTNRSSHLSVRLTIIGVRRQRRG